MTIVGIDDTDSRAAGMCTTYVGHRIKQRLTEQGFSVKGLTLTRLNPSAKYKTRGNASVSIHTNAPSVESLAIAKSAIDNLAASSDEMTNPGLVVFDGNTAPRNAQRFYESAITKLLDIREAKSIIEETDGMDYYAVDKERGLIGAVAAVGAWDAMTDTTYELISYRNPSRWGAQREVNEESVFEASEKYYPSAWDTVDQEKNEVVAVPHTPCPILYGVRGDSVEAVHGLSDEIQSEEVYSRQLFITNQGTDAHIQESTVSGAVNNSAYEITGAVTSAPTTKEGGHVFFEIADSTATIECAAFEPTKRFRTLVRKLRPGDGVTVRGEVTDRTLKLEKLRVNSLNTIEYQNPTCPKCGNSMASAGADQGYRCRNCDTHQETRERVPIERKIECGWYEVPPCARRHIAKPLVRMESSDPHPER